jgi:hypothetical protein
VLGGARDRAEKVREKPPVSLLLATLVALSGCAASHSGSTASGCREAAPVVAVSSSDAAPHVGELVTLGANASADAGAAGCLVRVGDFTYTWQLTAIPAQSHATLNAASVAAPSFVVDAPGEYVARVVATDANRDASEPAEVRIEAGACGANPPVVSLLTSAPAAPTAGDTVTLGASVTDADTDATCNAHPAVFTYTWSFSDLPPGSRAALNDAHVEHPSFVADVAGSYELELAVDDPSGRAGTASVTVDVSAASGGETNCDSSTPVAAAWRVVPGPPVDCSVSPIPTDLQGSDKIMLDAVPSSTDALCVQSPTLDYHWTLLTTPIAGAASKLMGTDSRTAVLAVTTEGEYQVRLVVTDAMGHASPELVCSVYAYNLP